MVGVEDVGGVVVEVADGDGVEVDEWVGCIDGGCVVLGGAVVDDVGVERSVLEEGEGADEDTVGVGENGEDGSFCVSEGIDGEKLAAGG